MNSGGGPVAQRTAARTAGSRWALWTAIAVLVGLGLVLVFLLAQATADQIEKAHLAGRPAKGGQHLATGLGGAVERGEIDDRQW